MYHGECYQTEGKSWKWRIYYRRGKQMEPVAVSAKPGGYASKKGALRSLRSMATRPVHVLV